MLVLQVGDGDNRSNRSHRSMIIYLYITTLFSGFMVSFKAGHIKGSKGEKYEISSFISILPYLAQLIVGIIFIVRSLKA